jgi:serine/threonine protein kinase
MNFYQFLEKIDGGDEGFDVKLSLIYEELKNPCRQLVAKKIEPTEITDPDVGKENDKRGSGPRFIRRKFYMRGIEVACKPIKVTGEYWHVDKSKEEEERIRFERHMAILMKASQSPNIIRFYGLSEIDGEKVMVLEWAQFGSLRQRYKNKIDKIPLKLKVFILLYYFSMFCYKLTRILYFIL